MAEFTLAGFDTVRGLMNTGGSEAFYKQMLFDFAREYANHSEKIWGFLETGQNEEARRLAHSLKGVARTLGATRLAQITTDAEEAIKSKNLFRFKQLYPALKNELCRVCKVVSEFERKELLSAILTNPQTEIIDDKLFYALDELGEFVKSGNYRAERMASQLKEQYAGGKLGELFNALFLAVEDLDSKNAMNCIDRIKKTIEGEE